MSGWMVAMPLLMICNGAAILVAFWLGAWAREPFKIRPHRKARAASSEEAERKKQQDSIFNYSLDDARRAARESGRFE